MAVPAITANLAFFSGEKKIIQDSVFQSNGTTPQDITGWSVTFKMHHYGDPSSALVTKTVGSGIVLTTPTSGIMQITLDAVDTVSIHPGLYEYYVERTDSSSNAVVTRGCITLQQRRSQV